MAPPPESFDSMAAYEAWRGPAEAAIRRSLNGSRAFVDAIRVLKQTSYGGSENLGPVWSREETGPALFQQSSRATVDEAMLVPASVQDVREHLSVAACVSHPADAVRSGASAAPSLKAAVERLVAWGPDAERVRTRRMAVLRRTFKTLEPLSRELRETWSPRHVTALPGGGLHCAAWACVAEAFGSDPSLVMDAVLGARPWGSVPASGVYSTKRVSPATIACDDLCHDEWNSWLTQSIEQRALACEGSGSQAEADMRSVFESTSKEIRKGLMQDFMSLDQVQEKFGKGKWRAIRRFGVWQKAKCRACDNAAESSHNAATFMHESLKSDQADFPARVAAVYASVMGSRVASADLVGGTDDIDSAYRRILCALPQYTVVALWHPVERRVVFSTLPGLNFGLQAAVLAFNRFPDLAVRLLRGMFAWTGSHYFDDFLTVEPKACAGSGQEVLREVMELLGLPVSPEKHVSAAPVFVFLGVQCSFLGLRSMEVSLGITAARASSLCEDIASIMDADTLGPGEASRLAGRLSFATTWVAGRMGRALMQPVYLRAASKLRGQTNALAPGLRLALTFFRSILKEVPPARPISLTRGVGRPPLVWTDAMWEPSQTEKGVVAFVVCFPPGFIGPEATWIYGAQDTPQDVMRRFVEKRQYIGQLELLAAVLVYYSVPELRGSSPIHWIDNTSAIATLIKGYSGAPDSARLLHAFKAFAFGFGVHPWFQWVPSKANIADMPSRHDLSLLGELGATRRDIVFPPFPAWDSEALEWVKAGASAVVQVEQRRKRKRGRSSA